MEWTLAPAVSDCAPGHMGHYILCAQRHIRQGDLDGALLYYEFANYLLPLAIPCMDKQIWTITPGTFYDRYRALAVAVEIIQAMPAWRPNSKELMDLAWRPVRAADIMSK